MTQDVTGTVRDSGLISLFENATQLVQFDNSVREPASGKYYSAAYIPGNLSERYNFPDGTRVAIRTTIRGQDNACFVTSMSLIGPKHNSDME